MHLDLLGERYPLAPKTVAGSLAVSCGRVRICLCRIYRKKLIRRLAAVSNYRPASLLAGVDPVCTDRSPTLHRTPVRGNEPIHCQAARQAAPPHLRGDPAPRPFRDGPRRSSFDPKKNTGTHEARIAQITSLRSFRTWHPSAWRLPGGAAPNRRRVKRYCGFADALW
jgi:hypothetical protein